MSQMAQWRPPGTKLPKPEPKAKRDFVAEAKAAINASDQKPEVIAAVILAQALDRFGEKLESAAAIANYKRT